MSPYEARELLHLSALKHKDTLSVSEWESLIATDSVLSEAVSVIGTIELQKISVLVFEWDKAKRSRNLRIPPGVRRLE